MKYVFEIAIDIDDNAIAARGKNWLRCALESADEFAQELKASVEKHPFVQACNITSEAAPSPRPLSISTSQHSP